MKLMIFITFLSLSVISQTRIETNPRVTTAFLSLKDSHAFYDVFGSGEWRTRYGSVILDCFSKENCRLSIYKTLGVDGIEIEENNDFVYALVSHGHNIDLFYWEFFNVPQEKLSFNTTVKYFFTADNKIEIVCYKNSYKSIDNYECEFKIIK